MWGAVLAGLSGCAMFRVTPPPRERQRRKGGGGGHKEEGGQITGWMKTPTDGGGNDDNNDGIHRDKEWFLVAAMDRGRGDIEANAGK